MNKKRESGKIRKVAFIYLIPESGEYCATDDLGYSVQRRPQLGLQYLSAILKKKGIKTNIFDQAVASFSLEWLIKELMEYDLAGFYCSDPQEDKVKMYCRKIKKKPFPAHHLSPRREHKCIVYFIIDFFITGIAI